MNFDNLWCVTYEDPDTGAWSDRIYDGARPQAHGEPVMSRAAAVITAAIDEAGRLTDTPGQMHRRAVVGKPAVAVALDWDRHALNGRGTAHVGIRFAVQYVTYGFTHSGYESESLSTAEAAQLAAEVNALLADRGPLIGSQSGAPLSTTSTTARLWSSPVRRHEP